MAIKQQLQQRQVQRLILAPALQQAIKLLPLTNLELIEIAACKYPGVMQACRIQNVSDLLAELGHVAAV